MKKKRIKKNKNFKAVKQRITRSLIIIGALSTISIITVGVWKLHDVFEPISSFASTQDIVAFNPNENTVIFAYKNSESEVVQVHIVGLNRQEKTVRELVIPGNTMTELPLGLDEYQLKNIFKVIHPETETNVSAAEIEIFKQALQNVTATLSDQIIVIKDEVPPESVVESFTQPSTLARILLDQQWVKAHLTTSLNKAEILQYVWNLTTTQGYNTRNIALANSDVVIKTQLKDGTNVIKIDQIKSDALNKALFEKINMTREQIPIRIINTTQTNGLAAHVERLFENAGGYIIETDSSEEHISTTQMIIHRNEIQESYTLQLIRSMLHVPLIQNVEEGDFHYAVTIKLGEDYATFMRGQESDTQK